MPIIYSIAISLLSIVVSTAGLKANTQQHSFQLVMGVTSKQENLSSFATASLCLEGCPEGGEIELFVFNTKVRIRTFRGDSVNKVAKNIAIAINANVALQNQAIRAKINGSAVVLSNTREYDLSFCTTDKGIRAPPKPQNLTCAVRFKEHMVEFHWENPEGCYDRIHIVESGIPIGESLPGAITNFSYDYLTSNGHIYTGIHTYRIVGVANGVPSCAAVCEVFIKAP